MPCQFSLFVFSLLSKGQAVTLPMVLLLIDYYKDRKFDKKVWLEKAPFFYYFSGHGCSGCFSTKRNPVAIADIPNHAWYDRIFFVHSALLITSGKWYCP